MKKVMHIVQNEHPDEVRELPVSESTFAHIARELKQRRVCRAAMTYVLVMWFNLQIADVIFPLLELPEWSIKLVVILAILGFPPVLLLAWVFQITPEGVVVDGASNREPNRILGTFDSVVSLALLALALLLTCLLVFEFLAPSVDSAPAIPAATQSCMAVPRS